ncbi:MAG: YggS family pyridoxal phosphate-dependent enzyme, partial [Clostridia bacterium]|nr:YggS family pyridoxal phosphate-dependent enzyme [Clostridia bacterium]
MESLETIISNIVNVKAELKTLEGADNIATLVLATKTVPRTVLEALAEYDKLIFGENRVQELVNKYFEHKNVDWHFIGQLQTNKVKYIVPGAYMIQSVDSERLAREIERQAARIGRVMDILIEVNIGGEDSK